MEKILSQTEIDELFRTARSGAAGDGKTDGHLRIERWDLHQAGILRKEQLNSISQSHENFARDLTASVGSYLRDKFEVTLVAVEQLAYRDFLGPHLGGDLLRFVLSVAGRRAWNPASGLEPGVPNRGACF